MLYTIGHSTHSIDYFLEMLLHYQVSCVVDVRSLPASRFNPQYNKKALSRSLEDRGIVYQHFPDEFGARLSDTRVLDEEGRVDFAKVRNSKPFTNGVERLSKTIWDGHTVALMCSEADPLSCHRFAMISPALKHFEIRHILKDKTTITQQKLEESLLKQYAKKLPQKTLFESPSRDELLNEAFRLLNKDVAYSPK